MLAFVTANLYILASFWFLAQTKNNLLEAQLVVSLGLVLVSDFTWLCTQVIFVEAILVPFCITTPYVAFFYMLVGFAGIGLQLTSFGITCAMGFLYFLYQLLSSSFVRELAALFGL